MPPSMMVSALVSLFVVVMGLIESFGSLTTATIVTGLVIGLSLLLIASRWPQLRYAVVSRLPEKAKAAVPAA